MPNPFFRLSLQTKIDIDAIWDYIGIENDNPDAARRVLDRLLEAFTFLADHPGSGMARDDLRPNLRMFSPRRPAHSYVIFFYPLGDAIEVSTIVHGSRDFPAIFTASNR